MQCTAFSFQSLALALGFLLLAPPGFAQQGSASQAEIVRTALSAAPASVALGATVRDWQNNVLREGTNGWTCFPPPPQFATGPMCLDEPWMKWAHAWMNKKPVEGRIVGISYMLQGDSGASNTDPHATGATPHNHWVVAGPHIMVFVPDTQLLNGFNTDPKTGGPWVMWQGTPYAHIMVPVH